ncbi:GCN5 family acetyltransferase [Arthrobacter sp. ERGS1:01]|uniref:GNAT family N-acetyltransferase n=1 Tax=Arthrobacter sp. ERGS1:01 TaxID=1704044 RepID=UPI0006B4FD21|nr:GNAT family N-acetyltransferase [Arthrobacter sp. ERGS1:01]ALE07050.1 GCN5 family acetyltransferase [Arthrobacter sp. ERGS1:01]
MTFEYSSAPIVRLAWERGLGLPAHTLISGDDGSRITHVTDSGALTFVRLWDQSILSGPADVVAAAEKCTDEELAEHAFMLRLTRDFGGRGGGTHSLSYADDLPLRQPDASVTVSHGNPEAVALEALCPPDDVNDVGLARLAHKFTLMDSGESDAHPVATGAYAEYEGLLAQLGTLVAPDFRRRGLGLLATNIAAHEALASGLILQWRADVNNTPARALAVSAGFIAAGLQTSVSLQSPQR